MSNDFRYLNTFLNNYYGKVFGYDNIRTYINNNRDLVLSINTEGKCRRDSLRRISGSYPQYPAAMKKAFECKRLFNILDNLGLVFRYHYVSYGRMVIEFYEKGLES